MPIRTVATRALLSAALVCCTATTQAALVSRAGGLVYDDVQNITWLQNWSTTAAMSWAAANTWANNLVYGGYSDWRLPAANTTATSNCSDNFAPGGGFPNQYFGFNCTGSEMGYMFYNYLGGKAGESVLTQGSDTQLEKANFALFTNVQPFAYWSGTEYAPNPIIAWYFDNSIGRQANAQKNDFFLSAVAVRSGDVVAPVPLPAAGWLLLAGVGALSALKLRRSSVPS